MKILAKIFASHKPETSELISILQDIQEKAGYLPEYALLKTAQFLKIPSSKVFGVATFYTQFHLTRQGKHKRSVCCGTACHVRDSSRVMKAITRKLKIEPGQTTEDYEFSLERVACFGSCAIAPVMVVDGKVYGKVTDKKAEEITNGIRGRKK